jgi:hypothetical protein
VLEPCIASIFSWNQALRSNSMGYPNPHPAPTFSLAEVSMRHTNIFKMFIPIHLEISSLYYLNC